MAQLIKILEPDELFEIYSIPNFDNEQREIFFSLDDAEFKAAKYYGTFQSQILFIIQLAYFKAKKKFFVFKIDQVSEDAIYIQNKYFPSQIDSSVEMVSKPTRLHQQKKILNLYGYRNADDQIRNETLNKAMEYSSRFVNPIYIFREIYSFLDRARIVLPAYSTMQKLVQQSLIMEQKRLDNILDEKLSLSQKEELQSLLEDKGENYYLLTWLQQDPANFNPLQIRKHVERKIVLDKYYDLSKFVIPDLKISNENIKYYGSLAAHYPIFQLKQFHNNYSCLLLLCFSYYRYRETNDILIEAFRFYVRNYEDEAKKATRDYIYKYKQHVSKQLNKVPAILGFFVNDKFDDDIPFGQVRREVLQLLDEDNILILADFIRENGINEDEIRWQHFEEMKLKISRNLRFLFINIEFQSSTPSSELLDATQTIKTYFKKGKNINQIPNDDLSLEFISKNARKHLYVKSILDPNRYEIQLYQSLRKQIESGDIFVVASFQYQSFDGDLIPRKHWNQHKESILKHLDLEKLKIPITDMLKSLELKLDYKFQEVNRAISNGENKEISIKLNKNGEAKWTLPYKTEEKTYNHHIYGQFPTIGIVPLLEWVNQKTNFTSAFDHILEKGGKHQFDIDSLFGCLIAFGTNSGIKDISDRSDISFYELSGTAEKYIRLETLQNANKLIVDATAQLPMFKLFNVNSDIIHSSSDGQKFETQFDTINSRHSPKYFGLGKGITVYSLVANHIPVNAKIIGANEHESHYVFDLLFNNITDVKPETHSTDTHGTNEVNFAILDFFNYQFAPR